MFRLPLAFTITIARSHSAPDSPPMDTSKLEQAVDRLTSASTALAGKVDGVVTELAALRDKVNNPPPPADDTAGQSAVDGAVARLTDAADALDRANSSIDGASAAGSSTPNASGSTPAPAPEGDVNAPGAGPLGGLPLNLNPSA
jgi:hypothetical protein